MGFTLWFTGLSGAGKTTLATAIASKLRERGVTVECLDADVLRSSISPDLGFSKADRDRNVRTLGYIAKVLANYQIAVVVAAISPYRSIRDEMRYQHLEQGVEFIEIFVDAPIEVVMRRDVKGLYGRALRGEVAHVSGLSDPYEWPLSPELHVNTAQRSSNQCVEEILRYLQNRGLIDSRPELR